MNSDFLEISLSDLSPSKHRYADPWPVGGGDQGGRKATTRNLYNMKRKRADQPGNKRVTPYCIHVLLSLNRRGWKQLIFKNVCICKMFCAVL